MRSRGTRGLYCLAGLCLVPVACVSASFDDEQFLCDPVAEAICPNGMTCGADGRCRIGGGPEGGSDPGGSCGTSLFGPELVAVPTKGGARVCVDRTEVTRAQYNAWWEGGFWDPLGPVPGCGGEEPTPKADWDPDVFKEGDRPVAFVTWCYAARFCKAAGKHLCGRIGGGTVAAGARNDAAQSEWFAACSSGGALDYPYGNTYQPEACNGADAGHGQALPVMSLPECQTAAGVFDLGGNLWEWVDSCEDDDTCLIRGGGHNADAKSLVCAAPTVTGKGTPKVSHNVTIGFRCCGAFVPSE